MAGGGNSRRLSPCCDTRALRALSDTHRGIPLARVLAVLALIGSTACDTIEANFEGPPMFGRSSAITNGRGGYPINGENVGVEQLRDGDIAAIDLDRFWLPGLGDAGKTAYEVASTNADARNRLQDALFRQSHEICEQHKVSITAIASSTAFGFSAVTTTLGAVGAIVTGATAARALAGGAALSNGLRNDIDRNIYRGGIAPAINRQIDQLRERRLQQIVPKRGRDVAAYSVDEAILDVQLFHQECSFAAGVNALAMNDQRPATVEELRTRLATLQTQLRENEEVANALADGDAKRITQRTSADLSQMIRAVTIQIAQGMGLPVIGGAAVFAAESPLIQTAPARSAAVPN